jgi:type II secretory pathway component PulF
MHTTASTQRSFRISLRRQIILFKQLGFFLKSGSSIEDCFSLCIGTTKKNGKNAITAFMEAVRGDITAGISLHEALGVRCKNISSPLLALCEAGEESGGLREALERVCQELVKKETARKKTVSALMYPACIALLAIILTAGMTFGIFPKIRPLLESMHTALPFPTRALIYISDTVTNRWQIIVLTIFGVIDFFWLLAQSKKMIAFSKDTFNRFVLMVPIVRDLSKNATLATFTGMVGTLTASGFPLPSGCKRARPVNSPYAKAIDRISAALETGDSLSESFSRYPKLFPDILIQLITAGEASGSVAETFSFLSVYFQNECDELMKKLSSLLEPALMVIMGCSVGFIALAMILPIYALSQSVSAIH